MEHSASVPGNDNRIQSIHLLTVGDLLAGLSACGPAQAGKQIEMPPIQQVGATFKKAPRAALPAAEQGELSVNGRGQ